MKNIQRCLKISNNKIKKSLEAKLSIHIYIGPKSCIYVFIYIYIRLLFIFVVVETISVRATKLMSIFFSWLLVVVVLGVVNSCLFRERERKKKKGKRSRIYINI